jgi:hypothetical protein
MNKRIKDVLKRLNSNDLLLLSKPMQDASKRRDAEREKVRVRIAKRWKRDTKFRLLRTLRGRVAAALRAQKAGKWRKTAHLIGCSIEELKRHLETQFKQGMTWDNHGKHWHIDHIKPCTAFDLTKPEEQLACFHWSNLQPLTASENLRKSDKWSGL